MSEKEEKDNDLKVSKITFKSDVRDIFKKDEVLEITKPFLVLVGKNGSGKSTILDIIRQHFNVKDDSFFKNDKLLKDATVEASTEKFTVKYHDFHGDDKKFSGTFGDDIQAQLMAMKASSGIGSLIQFGSKAINKVQNGLIILDEPCRGLSIKAQHDFAIGLMRICMLGDNQLIISTHSEYIMNIAEKFSEFSQLYSVEHKRNFATTKEFIAEHLKG